MSQLRVLYITPPCPSLFLSPLQGQLIPEVSRALQCMRRGRSERKRNQRGALRDSEHRHLGGGERYQYDDEHSDAFPLLPLMFNHETVDADPSL